MLEHTHSLYFSQSTVKARDLDVKRDGTSVFISTQKPLYHYFSLFMGLQTACVANVHKRLTESSRVVSFWMLEQISFSCNNSSCFPIAGIPTCSLTLNTHVFVEKVEWKIELCNWNYPKAPEMRRSSFQWLQSTTQKYWHVERWMHCRLRTKETVQPDGFRSRQLNIGTHAFESLGHRTGDSVQNQTDDRRCHQSADQKGTCPCRARDRINSNLDIKNIYEKHSIEFI